MPRPMRLAAPVTRTIFPLSAESDCWLAMTFDLLGFHAVARRFGQAAGDVSPAPEYRGRGTERARDGADGARIPMLRGDSGEHHRDHHHAPRRGFDGGEDASAIIVGDVAH